MNVNSSTTAGAQVALSILTRGGDGGSTRAAPPPAATVARTESPAVIIDPRIEELVGQQAEAAGGESGEGVDTVAARMQRFEWMRGMVEGAELAVVQRKQSLENVKKVISLYEQTGKFYQRNPQGEFVEYTPKEGWKPGDLEKTIEATRNSIEYKTNALPESIKTAETMRKNYENIIKSGIPSEI